MAHFKVQSSEEGARLDKFLAVNLGKSRQAVKNLIDSGAVKVNGKRVVIASWEISVRDSISVGTCVSRPAESEGGERSSNKKAKKKDGRPLGQKPVKVTGKFINVIHEDRDIIVTEKPAGVVIQAGRGSFESTYVDRLRAYLTRKHKGKGSFVKAVHRLDKETSGLMVFATSKTGEKLIDQFKNHTVERLYLAVVEGAIDGENGVIDTPIKKGDFGHGKKASIARDGDGARAITHYMVKERYANATLVRLDLKTGRTHQARVHMASIGHPIVGDRVYGKQSKLGLGRQALHSHILAFKHPENGVPMKFRSELPEDMDRLVDELRGS